MDSVAITPKQPESESTEKANNDTVDATTDSDADVSNVNDSHNANDNTNSALALTHEALFAKRYVTAEKFGQASNDPRVVRSQQAQVNSTTIK